MKAITAAIAVMTLAGCGPGAPERDEVAAEFYARWIGPAAIEAANGLRVEMAMDVGIVVRGDDAYIDQLCPLWHSKATGKRTGDTIEWTGELVCAEAPVGGCEKAVVAFTSVTIQLLDSDHVLGRFTGRLSGYNITGVPFKAEWHAERMGPTAFQSP